MRKTTLIILAVCVMTVTVFAQAESTDIPASVNPLDLLIGTGVSFIVTFLKRISFIEKHPKIVATAFSLLITGVTTYAGSKGNSGVWPFVVSILTQLSVAIGTHEILTKPVKSFLVPPSDDTLDSRRFG